MYEGDAYAIQGITKTDRLGMLLSGTSVTYSDHILSDNNVLGKTMLLS